MIVVISPAKTLDFETPVPVNKCTKARFASDADALVGRLREMSAAQISKLMKISAKLGELNHARYQDWRASANGNGAARAAIFAFKGDVYAGLDALNLTRDELDFAQNHLRVLSGLYGVLRPFDALQPYRLEMGTALKTDKGDNLYAYWGSRITDCLNGDLKRAASAKPSESAKASAKKASAKSVPVLINLASQEYFGAVRATDIKARVITPVFKEWRDGKLKFISFNAKKARGMMSRYFIQRRLSDPEGLKQFDVGGYRYDESGSSDNEWLFARAQ